MGNDPQTVALATSTNLQPCRQKRNVAETSAHTDDGHTCANKDLISGNIHQCQLVVCRLSHVRLFECFLLWLMVMQNAAGAMAAPTSTIQYGSHDRVITCFIATCLKGYETVPCTVDGTRDTCSLCPPDKYQPVDNVTSHMALPCYRVHCAPDNQRQVQAGDAGPGNPPHCECDTTRDYYQQSGLPEDCKRKVCGRLENLILDGTCVCKDGRVKNKNGSCVWQQSQSTATVVHLPQGTQSQVTQSTTQASVNTSKSTSDPNDDFVAVSTLTASSPPPTTATPPVTETPSHDRKSGIITVVLVLIGLIGLIGISCALYKLVGWTRRRREVNETCDQGEVLRLAPDEDSTGTSSSSAETSGQSEPEEKAPLQINNYNFIVGNKNVQLGDHNQIVNQTADDTEE